jgi:hypothetical protein
MKKSRLGAEYGPQHTSLSSSSAFRQPGRGKRRCMLDGPLIWSSPSPHLLPFPLLREEGGEGEEDHMIRP